MNADELQLSGGDHVVQFYESDAELVDLVGGYLAASLREGAPVLVVATEAHRRSFVSAMTAAGVDTELALSTGRLAMRDAQAMLDLFMVDGLPDATRFFAAVGELLAPDRAGESEARVYGEMVAVLWASGNAAGAIALEALWNDLAGRLPFALLCAYPLRFLDDPGAAELIDHVCELHSDIVHDSSPASPTRSETFGGTLESLALARRFVTATLREWRRDRFVDDAVLVVSELATNAVAHASSEFRVTLTDRLHGVRVEVADLSALSPRPRQADIDGPGGRGLQIVDLVSGSWGHRLVSGGKAVWAQLRHAPA